MGKYGDILWRPSAERAKASSMGRFAAFASGKTGLDLGTYQRLHAWSVDRTAEFWGLLEDFVGVVWREPPTKVYTPPPPDRMLGAQWFAQGRLNYAENLLAGPERPDAVIALAEGAPRRTYTLAQLRIEAGRCAAALRAAGVGRGDRVAGVIANVPEALIAMLATSSLGAAWCSCSPDFGAAAVVDRLAQVEPKVVFYTSAYVYGGKRFDCGPTVEAVRAKLPTVKLSVLVDHLGEDPKGHVTFKDLLARHANAGIPSYTPQAFDEPLFILFSSGTTGVPKCIVHGVGGTLLQHKKELLLHSDVGLGSRLMFYTTCGWMMWNWMVSALATGASLVLYEGSPVSPDAGVLWRAVRDEGVTAFGTSPKFIQTCMVQNVEAGTILGQGRPRTVLSTGAPLLPEHFAWLYEQVGGAGFDLHLASISGGTDIVSCFMLGTPTLPVRSGEIQAPGLGMAVDAWSEEARPVRGQKAELVCTKPFVSMPVGFWNDADGKKYRTAYFEHFLPQGKEVWRHGDYVEITPELGVIVYGRSDATLNPGGVRIGTAELYRQVEAMEEVADSLAIGRKAFGGDTDIVLFVKLKPGRTLSPELCKAIKDRIRAALTPRHVPREIRAVKDIPYTRSGKKVELAVTNAIHGDEVTNLAALANPEAMDEYLAMGPKKA